MSAYCGDVTPALPFSLQGQGLSAHADPCEPPIAAVPAASEGGLPASILVEGFANPALNKVFTVNPSIKINEQPTLWESSGEYFMYFKGKEQQKVISARMDGQLDVLEEVKKGQMRGIACESDGVWQEFIRGKWRQAAAKLTKLVVESAARQPVSGAPVPMAPLLVASQPAAQGQSPAGTAFPQSTQLAAQQDYRQYYGAVAQMPSFDMAGAFGHPQVIQLQPQPFKAAVDTVIIEGFRTKMLNTTYLLDPDILIGGRATYWDQGRRLFMYYQESQQRWAISNHDLAGGDDALLDAKRGGLRGWATEVQKGGRVWQEFCGREWLTVELRINKLCLGNRAQPARPPVAMLEKAPPALAYDSGVLATAPPCTQMLPVLCRDPAPLEGPPMQATPAARPFPQAGMSPLPAVNASPSLGSAGAGVLSIAAPPPAAATRSSSLPTSAPAQPAPRPQSASQAATPKSPARSPEARAFSTPVLPSTSGSQVGGQAATACATVGSKAHPTIVREVPSPSLARPQEPSSSSRPAVKDQTGKETATAKISSETAGLVETEDQEKADRAARKKAKKEKKEERRREKHRKRDEERGTKVALAEKPKKPEGKSNEKRKRDSKPGEDADEELKTARRPCRRSAAKVEARALAASSGSAAPLHPSTNSSRSEGESRRAAAGSKGLQKGKRKSGQLLATQEASPPPLQPRPRWSAEVTQSWSREPVDFGLLECRTSASATAEGAETLAQAESAKSEPLAAEVQHESLGSGTAPSV